MIDRMGDSSRANSARVAALTEEASTWMTSGDNRRAFDCYRDAFGVAVKAGSPQAVLACACNYGASCLVNNRTEEAINLLEEYLDRVRETDSEDENFFTLIGDVHYNLALAYAVNENFRPAIGHFRSAIQIFESHGVAKPLAETYQQLGDVHKRYLEPSEAVSAYELAAEAFRADEDPISEAKIYLKLAKIHLDREERNGCLKRLGECERICGQIMDTSKMSGTFSRLTYNLAMTFRKVKERDKALTWLQHTEGMIPSASPTNADIKLLALALQGQGKMFAETGDYNKAAENYQQAAANFGQLGDIRSRAWCFYHLGGIHLLLRDSKNAERNYHLAHQMLEDTGKVGSLWKVKEGLGDLNVATHQHKTAVTYYRETLTLIGIHSAGDRSTDQRRVMDKLTALLASQKKGHRGDLNVSYHKRTPVVLPTNIRFSTEVLEALRRYYPDHRSKARTPTFQRGISSRRYSVEMCFSSSQEAPLEYSSIDDPTGPAIVTGLAVADGPETSTPKPNEWKKTTKHSKHQGKKKGRKRADMLHKPVPNGVSEYDSDSDLALMEREMLKQLTLSLERTNSLPQNLGSTYEVPDGGHSLERTASQEKKLRRFSHDVPGTADSERIREERRRSWKLFGQRGRSESSSSSSPGGSGSSSSVSVAETESVNSRNPSTSGANPLYATIAKKKSAGNQSARKSAHDDMETTDLMCSTMPTRLAPEPPGERPPTLPPLADRPMIMGEDYSADSTTDGDSTIPSHWTPNEPPTLPPMENHPLVMREQGLGSSEAINSPRDVSTGSQNGGRRDEEDPYEMATPEGAFWHNQQPSPSHHHHEGGEPAGVKRRPKVHSSRMCLLM